MLSRQSLTAFTVPLFTRSTMSDILSPVGREKPVATQAIPLERNGSGDSISTGSSLRNEKDGANPQAELLSEDVAAKVADLRAKLNETKIHGLYNRKFFHMPKTDVSSDNISKARAGSSMKQ